MPNRQIGLCDVARNEAPLAVSGTLRLLRTEDMESGDAGLP